MTNEEAISKLLNIKAYLTAGNPIWDTDTIRDSMDMAIESLKHQEYTEQIRWERDIALEQLKKLGYSLGEKPRVPSAEQNILNDGTLTITVQHGMLNKVNRVIVNEVGTKFCKMMYQDALPSVETKGDLISREQAIKWLDRWEGYLDEDMILRMKIGLKRDVPSAERKYKRALKIACELLNGAMIYGVDADTIFDYVLETDGCVGAFDLEEFILNNIDRFSDVDEIRNKAIERLGW